MLHAIFSLFFAANISAAQPRSSAQAKQTDASKFTMTGKYFECSVPRGWTSKSDRNSDLTGVYAVEFMPPDFAPSAPVSVVISYYSEGNKAHKNSASFMKKMTSNPLKLSGKTAGAVSEAMIGGKKALTLERSHIIYLPPNDPSAKKIQLKEKYTVIDAAKGFYVVQYQASSELFDKYMSVYDATVKSFKPLP